MSDNVIRGAIQGAYRSSTITLSTDNSPVSLGVDVNGYLLTDLGVALSKSLDSIVSRPEATSYVDISASGVVANAPCILTGMFVNSSTSGTVKLYDNASAASGIVLNNTTGTLAVGYYPLGNANTTNGVYCTVGGTLDVTFYYILK